MRGARAASAAIISDSSAVSIATLSITHGTPAKRGAGVSLSASIAARHDQRAIGEFGVASSASNSASALRERLRGFAFSEKRLRSDARHPKLDYRARERARKTGALDDRVEVGQRAGLLEPMNHSRRDRFDSERRGGRESCRKHAIAGEQSRKPVEGYAMDSEQRAARERDRSHQVIGGLTRGGDDQRFALPAGQRFEHCGGGAHALGCARRTDDFARSMFHPRSGHSED